jgi:hypothetical protein
MPTQTDSKTGRFRPGESGNPNGRPVLHHMRRLSTARRTGELDEESEAAVCAKVNEYAADGGGLQSLSNRELAILRDAAICDLIIAEAFAYARRRGSIFRRDGQLIPVLDRNLLAYMNSKRLGLVALGLRPDRADTVPSLQEYLASRAAVPPAPAAPAVDAATHPEPSTTPPPAAAASEPAQSEVSG